MAINAKEKPGPEGGLAPVGGWWAVPVLDEGVGLTKGSLLLLASGFGPLWLQLCVNLWQRPQYQFFPLALAGVGLLGWRSLQTTPRPWRAGSAGVGLALLGCSLGLLAAGVWLWSPWLGMIASLLGWTGLCWRGGGGRLAGAMLPALVLALTFLPPPLGLDTRLMLDLRGLAVSGSSRVLDALGVAHVLSGNIIELPHAKLLVEEACSGINSFLLILAVGLFYLCWRRRSWGRILVCLPCALATVVLGNVGRITLGAWLQSRWNLNILSGWRHELVGLALVAGYVGFIWSLDALLEFIAERLVEPPAPPRAAPAAGPPEPALQTAPPAPPSAGGERRGRRWRMAGGVCALLGVASLARGYQHQRVQQAAGPMAASASALRAGAVLTLPERIGGWTRQPAEAPQLRQVETAGICSQIWKYQQGALGATVALDYPFRGYHDVLVCYRLAGWNLVQQQCRDGGGDARPAWMEVEMEQPPITWGALWFSTVDEQGRWMEAPAGRPVPGLEKRPFRERMARWISGDQAWQLPAGDEVITYRIQTLATGYEAWSAPQRKAAGELFAAARQLLAQQLLGQFERKTPARP